MCFHHSFHFRLGPMEVVFTRNSLFLFFREIQTRVCRTSLKFITLPKSHFLLSSVSLFMVMNSDYLAAMTANKSCVFLPSNEKCDCFNYTVNASNK